MRPPVFGQPFRVGARGFTLIEVLAVVIIVGILAVVAAPSIRHRMRANRTRAAAQGAAEVYRNARMQALGRGAAVLVRWDDTAKSFQVRERVQASAGGGCQFLPANSCSGSDWGDADGDNVVVDTFFPGGGGDSADILLEMYAQPAGTEAKVSVMDVCFTPMGRAFVRYATASGTAFTPLTSVVRGEAFRGATDAREGLTRHFMVLPNGAARTTDAAIEQQAP